MPLDLIVPLSFVLALVAYAWIAKWYLMPALAGLPRQAALVPLLLLHTFRFIGLAFLAILARHPRADLHAPAQA